VFWVSQKEEISNKTFLKLISHLSIIYFNHVNKIKLKNIFLTKLVLTLKGSGIHFHFTLKCTH
jgi:hypothetical protein